MLQNIYSRYQGGCMMLLHREGETVSFGGTAFLVHPEGYLLTAAHLLYSRENLMVAPWESSEDFAPLPTDTVAPLPASVARMDADHDLALLKFRHEQEISIPDHVVGMPADVSVGSGVACMGYAFGYQHIYAQFIQQAVISAKIVSANGTRLFLFDRMVTDGTRGGPLINLADDRVIGVVSGRFDPRLVTSPAEQPPAQHTHISYAISIEYAEGLMEQEGLSVI